MLIPLTVLHIRQLNRRNYFCLVAFTIQVVANLLKVWFSKHSEESYKDSTILLDQWDNITSKVVDESVVSKTPKEMVTQTNEVTGKKKTKAGQRFNKDAALLLTFSQQRLEQPPSACSASALLPEVQASAAGSWFCAWCLWHCGDSEEKTVSQTHPGPVRLACGRAFTKHVHQPCNVNTGLHPVPLLPGFNFQAKNACMQVVQKLSAARPAGRLTSSDMWQEVLRAPCTWWRMEKIQWRLGGDAAKVCESASLR